METVIAMTLIANEVTGNHASLGFTLDSIYIIEIYDCDLYLIDLMIKVMYQLTIYTLGNLQTVKCHLTLQSAASLIFAFGWRMKQRNDDVHIYTPHALN